MTQDHSVEIYTLGTFRVVVNGEPVPASAWRSRKAQTLFKYLLSQRGKRVPREVLLELMWPEEDPETAIGRLYTTLHLLRRAVEPDLPRYGESSVVRTGSGMYWCAPGANIWVDSEVFEDLYERAVREESSDPAKAWSLWQRCLQLYEGNYLEEDPYEEWTLLLREALLDKFVDGSMRAADLQFRLTGDAHVSAQICHNALQFDRFREELYQASIRYLLAADRPAEAAMQYRSLSAMLRDEFALEPSPETRALLEEQGIDVDRGEAGKAVPISKLVQRLPVADAAPPGPDGKGGPFMTDAHTFRALEAWNERLSVRYLTSFSVLTVSEPRVGAAGMEQLLQRLGRHLRNSDAVALDRDRIMVLLPYMERVGANVVARRVRAVAAEVLSVRPAIEIRVVSGRELALAGHA